MSDVQISGEGKTRFLSPLTEAGRTWLTANTSSAWKWISGSVVVDLRYVAPILDCMVADGLRVEI